MPVLNALKGLAYINYCEPGKRDPVIGEDTTGFKYTVFNYVEPGKLLQKPGIISFEKQGLPRYCGRRSAPSRSRTGVLWHPVPLLQHKYRTVKAAQVGNFGHLYRPTTGRGWHRGDRPVVSRRKSCRPTRYRLGHRRCSPPPQHSECCQCWCRARSFPNRW